MAHHVNDVTPSTENYTTPEDVTYGSQRTAGSNEPHTPSKDAQHIGPSAQEQLSTPSPVEAGHKRPSAPREPAPACEQHSSSNFELAPNFLPTTSSVRTVSGFMPGTSTPDALRKRSPSEKFPVSLDQTPHRPSKHLRNSLNTRCSPSRDTDGNATAPRRSTRPHSAQASQAHLLRGRNATKPNGQPGAGGSANSNGCTLRSNNVVREQPPANSSSTPIPQPLPRASTLVGTTDAQITALLAPTWTATSKSPNDPDRWPSPKPNASS